MLKKIILILIFNYLLTCGICLAQERELFLFKENQDTASLVLREGEVDTSKYNLIAHIDCGKNDNCFAFKTNGNDIGRIHYEKDYTQAAMYDKLTGWHYDNHYFSYQVRLNSPKRDLLIMFLDADNADRTFKIIINSKYSVNVNHLFHTSNEYVHDSWKCFNLSLSKNIIDSNILDLRFEHINMPNFPPALSDIWIYEKVNDIAYNYHLNEKSNL
ncbi:MAG: hypothetical protein QMC67_09315 [Candidatus Wallbacteria bacterium]